MISGLVSFLSGGVIGQIGKELNKAYAARLAAQNDQERVKADILINDMRTLQKLATEDMAFRAKKLAYWTGRVPLFIAELSGAVYFAAVMVDSTFPMEWLNPLELPEWFKPQYGAVMASVLGIGVVSRIWGKKRGK